MLNRNTLFALVGFQVLVLAGVFVKAYYPLLSGSEMVLRTAPRDPRDWFRGNYVDLTYNFSSINLLEMPHDLDTSRVYRFGDAVYVAFKENKGLYEPTGVWTEKPDGGQKFLRCVVQSPFDMRSYSTLYLKAGIESYFAPAEQAKEIENAISISNMTDMDYLNAQDKALKLEIDSLYESTDSLTRVNADSMQRMLDAKIIFERDRDPMRSVTVKIMVADDGIARIKEITYPQPKQKK